MMIARHNRKHLHYETEKQKRNKNDKGESMPDERRIQRRDKRKQMHKLLVLTGIL